ncbi:MAG: C39 family peptidase [Methanosarcinales archaeon]
MNTDIFDIGAGGKKSKRKIEKLGFDPQITSEKMPHTTQSSRYGCPIACATMILNYAGIKMSYTDLQFIFKNWRYMNGYQLKFLIESYGLKSVPVKNLDEAKLLLQEGKPVVVFVNRGTYAKGYLHWIVLRGVKGNVFAVSDPLDKNIRRMELRTLANAIKESNNKILFTIKI